MWYSCDTYREAFQCQDNSRHDSSWRVGCKIKIILPGASRVIRSMNGPLVCPTTPERYFIRVYQWRYTRVIVCSSMAYYATIIISSVQDTHRKRQREKRERERGERERDIMKRHTNPSRLQLLDHQAIIEASTRGWTRLCGGEVNRQKWLLYQLSCPLIRVVRNSVASLLCPIFL